MDTAAARDLPLRRVVGEVIGLGVAYLVTARAGLSLASVGHSVTLVWPPSGLAVAALTVRGSRLWPGVALAALLVNAATPGVPVAAAALMAAGNTAEALLGSWLLRRAHFDPGMRRVTDVPKLVILAGLLSTATSACVGTLALRLGGVISRAEVPLSLRVWWIGDLMGVLLFAPLLWSLRRSGLPRPPPLRRLVEAAVLAAALLAFGFAIFRQPMEQIGQGYLRSYLMFPVLLAAALRFEIRGAAWASLGLALIAVAATIHHTGPFALASPTESLVNLQIFMAIAVLTSLVLATAAAERTDAIRAREDFISIASHELRTPLTPLMLQIDRFRRRLDAGRDSADDLGGIQSSLQRQADRLTGLVDILLDITRLRAARMALDRQRLDLTALARDTVEGLAEELDRAGCDVVVEAPRPVFGSWDRTRLQQALTNLLTNAAKYAAGARVTVSVSAAGPSARLVVTDDGPGIPFGDQSRLFRRFARLPSTKARAGGLGLGLYITREIVEAHGGAIRLESRPGHGASFTCLIPLEG